MVKNFDTTLEKRDVFYAEGSGFGAPSETKKKELILKCTDNCSCLSIDNWEGEDSYFIMTYKNERKPLWYRFREAIKYIMGYKIVDVDLILTEEEFNKLREF